MKWKNVTTLVSYISVREKKVIEISHIDRRACVRSIYGLGQDKERGPREEGWEVKKRMQGGGEGQKFSTE